jgi:hypothetical protein
MSRLFVTNKDRIETKLFPSSDRAQLHDVPGLLSVTLSSVSQVAAKVDSET